MPSYQFSTFSGSLSCGSIVPGLLSSVQRPVVRFHLLCGSYPLPMYVVRLNLAAELYAWALAMPEHNANIITVSVVGHMASNGNTACLIADEVQFYTANPNLRVAAQRYYLDMLDGKFARAWPEVFIEPPVGERVLLDGAESASRL